MNGYILRFSMHITGENTVNNNACVYLVVFYAYYYGNTVIRCAWVHLVVFYAYTC